MKSAWPQEIDFQSHRTRKPIDAATENVWYRVFRVLDFHFGVFFFAFFVHSCIVMGDFRGSSFLNQFSSNEKNKTISNHGNFSMWSNWKWVFVSNQRQIEKCHRQTGQNISHQHLMIEFSNCDMKMVRTTTFLSLHNSPFGFETKIFNLLYDV